MRAAVFVLGRSGYVKVRDSQNGFTALVRHTGLDPLHQEPRFQVIERELKFPD